jgi:hypothetical protein
MRDILREIDNFIPLGATQGYKSPCDNYIPAYYKIPTQVTRKNNTKGHISTTLIRIR